MGAWDSLFLKIFSVGIGAEQTERWICGKVMATVPAIWIMIAVAVLSSFGTRMVMSFTSIYAVEIIGLSNTQLGLVSTTAGLITAALALPGGMMADRFGRKPMLVASWVMAVVSVVGFLTFRRFEAFLVFEIANALDPALWIPAWMALLSERVSSSRRSTVMGKIDAYARIASIPSPWIGGLLYSGYGFSAPLLVLFACLMIVGTLIFTIKEERPDE